jgi:DNA invertase Pin-like site-specific DNA recombinase
MKAAIYARVSSEKQAEKDLSIPAQLKALRKYALDRDWDISAEYVDEAESAKSANRPAFQEMITAAKKKERPFDNILVWKLSRFARNREDSVIYKSLLRKRGISLISINEQIDDTASGRLLEGMIEVIDEFYSANLAQDTMRGMKENINRGFFNGGIVPFGYRKIKVMVGSP